MRTLTTLFVVASLSIIAGCHLDTVKTGRPANPSVQKICDKVPQVTFADAEEQTLVRYMCTNENTKNLGLVAIQNTVHGDDGEYVWQFHFQTMGRIPVLGVRITPSESKGVSMEVEDVGGSLMRLDGQLDRGTDGVSFYSPANNVGVQNRDFWESLFKKALRDTLRTMDNLTLACAKPSVNTTKQVDYQRLAKGIADMVCPSSKSARCDDTFTWDGSTWTFELAEKDGAKELKMSSRNQWRQTKRIAVSLSATTQPQPEVATFYRAAICHRFARQ